MRLLEIWSTLQCVISVRIVKCFAVVNKKDDEFADYRSDRRNRER